MVFWDWVYDELSKDFPAVKTDMAFAEALTMMLVMNPHYFDLIVASNLFGDIITDSGAMLQGRMGFVAGGNINPEKNPFHVCANSWLNTLIYWKRGHQWD